jgi:hypothetical protein
MLLLASGLFAQVEFLIETPSGTKPLPPVYDFGSTPVGETRDAWLLGRNSGGASVTVTTLTIAGLGFSILNRPALPLALAPCDSIRFRVQFRPPSAGSFSATLRVNQTTAILRATASEAAMLSLVLPAGNMPIFAGQPIDFGPVERGQGSSLRVRAEGTGGSTVTLWSVSVRGEAFRLEGAPAAPLRLPEGEAVEFTIGFSPTAARAETGSLMVDGCTFPLLGTGIDPPLPSAVPVLSPEAPASGRQMRLAVALASPARSAGSGVVKMDFQPAAGLGDDPAAGFLHFAGRSAPFTITEGEDFGRFGGAREAIFQTGATAGTVHFSLELNGQRRTVSLTLPAAVVRAEEVSANRRTSSIEVQIHGLDNTRSASTLTFSFYDQNGYIVGTAIQADAAEAFRRYFATANSGGLFALRALFPVIGDAGLVRGVEIEILNSSGAARTGRIPIE